MKKFLWLLIVLFGWHGSLMVCAQGNEISMDSAADEETPAVEEVVGGAEALSLSDELADLSARIGDVDFRLNELSTLAEGGLSADEHNELALFSVDLASIDPILDDLASRVEKAGSADQKALLSQLSRSLKAANDTYDSLTDEQDRSVEQSRDAAQRAENEQIATPVEEEYVEDVAPSDAIVFGGAQETTAAPAVAEDSSGWAAWGAPLMGLAGLAGLITIGVVAKKKISAKLAAVEVEAAEKEKAAAQGEADKAQATVKTAQDDLEKLKSAATVADDAVKGAKDNLDEITRLLGEVASEEEKKVLGEQVKLAQENLDKLTKDADDAQKKVAEATTKVTDAQKVVDEAAKKTAETTKVAAEAKVVLEAADKVLKPLQDEVAQLEKLSKGENKKQAVEAATRLEKVKKVLADAASFAGTPKERAAQVERARIAAGVKTSWLTKVAAAFGVGKNRQAVAQTGKLLTETAEKILKDIPDAPENVLKKAEVEDLVKTLRSGTIPGVSLMNDPGRAAQMKEIFAAAAKVVPADLPGKETVQEFLTRGLDQASTAAEKARGAQGTITAPLKNIKDMTPLAVANVLRRSLRLANPEMKQVDVEAQLGKVNMEALKKQMDAGQAQIKQYGPAIRVVLGAAGVPWKGLSTDQRLQELQKLSGDQTAVAELSKKPGAKRALKRLQDSELKFGTKDFAVPDSMARAARLGAVTAGGKAVPYDVSGTEITAMLTDLKKPLSDIQKEDAGVMAKRQKKAQDDAAAAQEKKTKEAEVAKAKKAKEQLRQQEADKKKAADTASKLEKKIREAGAGVVGALKDAQTAVEARDKKIADATDAAASAREMAASALITLRGITGDAVTKAGFMTALNEVVKLQSEAFEKSVKQIAAEADPERQKGVARYVSDEFKKNRDALTFQLDELKKAGIPTDSPAHKQLFATEDALSTAFIKFANVGDGMAKAADLKSKDVFGTLAQEMETQQRELKKADAEAEKQKKADEAARAKKEKADKKEAEKKQAEEQRLLKDKRVAQEVAKVAVESADKAFEKVAAEGADVTKSSFMTDLGDALKQQSAAFEKVLKQVEAEPSEEAETTISVAQNKLFDCAAKIEDKIKSSGLPTDDPVVQKLTQAAKAFNDAGLKLTDVVDGTAAPASIKSKEFFGDVQKAVKQQQATMEKAEKKSAAEAKKQQKAQEKKDAEAAKQKAKDDAAKAKKDAAARTPEDLETVAKRLGVSDEKLNEVMDKVDRAGEGIEKAYEAVGEAASDKLERQPAAKQLDVLKLALINLGQGHLVKESDTVDTLMEKIGALNSSDKIFERKVTEELAKQMGVAPKFDDLQKQLLAETTTAVAAVQKQFGEATGKVVQEPMMVGKPAIPLLDLEKLSPVELKKLAEPSTPRTTEPTLRRELSPASPGAEKKQTVADVAAAALRAKAVASTEAATTASGVKPAVSAVLPPVKLSGSAKAKLSSDYQKKVQALDDAKARGAGNEEVQKLQAAVDTAATVLKTSGIQIPAKLPQSARSAATEKVQQQPAVQRSKSVSDVSKVQDVQKVQKPLH